MSQVEHNPDKHQRNVETIHAAGRAGEGAYEVVDSRVYRIHAAKVGLEAAAGAEVVAAADAIARQSAEFAEHDVVAEADAYTREAAAFAEHDVAAEADAIIARDAAIRQAEAQASIDEHAIRGSTMIKNGPPVYEDLQPSTFEEAADPQLAHMEYIQGQIAKFREQEGMEPVEQYNDDNFTLAA